jgi:HK97 family phage prohead protease
MTKPILPAELQRYTAISDDVRIGEDQDQGASRIRRFLISSGNVARDGHTLATNGWDLSAYKLNPVVLAVHDSDHIEGVIGRTVNFITRGDALYADIEFMAADLNPLADLILRMIDGGWLRACSVGFIPKKGAPAKDRTRQQGFDFTEQELLEISIVPVGSLPDALLAARKAGINCDVMVDWAKRILQADERDMPAMTQSRSIKISKRGLYSVGWLAKILGDLGYLQDVTAEEAEYEGDNSPVPGQLLDVVKALGQALIDMTAEEVGELIADLSKGIDVDANIRGGNQGDELLRMMRAMALLNADHRYSMMRAAESILSGADLEIIDHRRGRTLTKSTLHIRAGRVLSAENERCLRDTHDYMTRAIEGVAGILGQLDEADDDPADDDSTDDPADDESARALRARQAAAAVAIAQAG